MAPEEEEGIAGVVFAPGRGDDVSSTAVTQVLYVCSYL